MCSARAFGALAGAMRGDREPISSVVEFEGLKWRVKNARMDEMAALPREKGRVHPMPARREDQIKTIVAALKAHKLPPEAMLDGRFMLEPDVDIPPVAPVQEAPVSLTLCWGDRLSKRVMIKVAIELLAHFDSSAARMPALDLARRFARYDKGDEWDFRTGFDAETSGAGIACVDAPLVHGVDVWTTGPKLHYRMTLFTEMHFVGTMTKAWADRPFSASYTFDIKDPANKTLACDTRDGASLVSKSRHVRDHEMAGAMARFEEASLANSERRRMRAPPPDIKDLYPEVRAAMMKK